MALIGLFVFFLVFKSQISEGTSLMKRFRESQTTVEALRGSGDNRPQIPQPVQDVLISIDERLRGLDTLSYTLKIARLDFSLEQLVRRIENVESKLGRLETKFDVRIEKIENILEEKKEEFSNEQISRAMENLNEKFNNKAAYLDAKLDIYQHKVMHKLDSLERDIHNSVGDILERLVKGEEKCGILETELIRKEERLDEMLNEVMVFTKGELVNTINNNYEHLSAKTDAIKLTIHSKDSRNAKSLTDIQTNLMHSEQRIMSMLVDNNNKIDNLSSVISNGERGRSGAEMIDVDRIVTHDQLDNLTAVLDKALTTHEAQFKELDTDVEMYTKKVINGIQELWKTSDELKSDLSNTFEQGSKTREIVRREFQRLHEQIEPLPKLEPKLTDISEDLDNKVAELSATVDNSFATLLVAQNTFIDSCTRIQQEETHIYDILQQIVHEMRNRSITDIHRISSELRSQSSEINTSLAQVLTAVLMIGNNTVAAVNDILQQLKTQEKCVILRIDSEDLNLEAVCHQISIDQRFSGEKNASSEIFATAHSAKRNVIDELNSESAYDADSGHTSDQSLNFNEYDLDYQIPETYYPDKILQT